MMNKIVARRSSLVARCVPAFIAILFLLGCATSYDKRGVYYKVRMGDSIWQIARTHRVDVQELAEFNSILDPAAVTPGTKLYIPQKKGASFKKLPFGSAVGSGETVGGKRYARKKFREDAYSKPIETYRGRFDWPVDGRVGSLFGIRNGRRHDGVDISVPAGTPIHASAAGSVVFVGEMRGYGKLVLVRHKDDFFTAYAHNSKNKVTKGQSVKKGQVVALAGRTGRATAPHVHFEIRHGQTARNPLFFLPERGSVTAKNERKKK